MIYVDLTNKLQCVQPQIILDKIQNEISPWGPGINIFILLIRKCMKLTFEAGYKYFYTTNKEMNKFGSRGQVQIFLYY